MPSAANSHVIWPRSAQRAISRGTIGANNDGTRSHCITTAARFAAPSPSFAFPLFVARLKHLFYPPYRARYDGITVCELVRTYDPQQVACTVRS